MIGFTRPDVKRKLEYQQKLFRERIEELEGYKARFECQGETFLSRPPSLTQFLHPESIDQIDSDEYMVNQFDPFFADVYGL